MAEKMTRRDALVAGAVSAGAVLGAGCSDTHDKSIKPQTGEKPFSERSWWPPGPDKDLVRDLTPGTTPVRLACMSPKTTLNYPEKESVTEAVKRIRDGGYTAANSHYSIGTRNKWLDASESEITELKEALAHYDVDLFDTMVWTNLIHPDEKTRQNNLKYVAENIEAADRIGCRIVTMVTGSCDTEYYIGMHPDNWTRKTWNLTLDSIRQLLRDTTGCTTALGMEAVITTNLDCPVAHKRLMDDIGDPRCKVCLDPTNMMSFERYYHSTELLNECFGLLGEDIIGCHAKDMFIRRDVMLAHIIEVPAGEGVQDYETYLVRMSRMKWPRTLLLEHLPAEKYPPVKAFIEKTAAKVGVRIYT